MSITTQETQQHERLAASVAHFLIQGGTDVELKAARAMTYCTVVQYTVWNTNSTYNCDGVGVLIELAAPRPVFDVVRDPNHPVRQAIVDAFNAVLPSEEWVDHLTVRAELVEIDVDRWRDEIRRALSHDSVTNQGLDLGRQRAIKTWMNLRFRSATEVRIAQALDRMGVFFVPNCMGRIGKLGERENREADFLVILNGKPGILEVDGDVAHPPTRTVQDHARDRLFKEQGVRVVEHFDATECWDDADRVVGRFLDLLKDS